MLNQFAVRVTEADTFVHATRGEPEPATSQVPNDNPRDRFEALARAYRRWALAEPHRYRLLFGPPLPGYEAHAQRLVEASWAAMHLLLDVLRECEVGAAKLSQPLGAELTARAQQHNQRVDPGTGLHAVLIWSQLHGIVSVEIAGNLRAHRHRRGPALQDPANRDNGDAGTGITSTVHPRGV